MAVSAPRRRPASSILLSPTFVAAQHLCGCVQVILAETATRKLVIPRRLFGNLRQGGRDLQSARYGRLTTRCVARPTWSGSTVRSASSSTTSSKRWQAAGCRQRSLSARRCARRDLVAPRCHGRGDRTPRAAGQVLRPASRDSEAAPALPSACSHPGGGGAAREKTFFMKISTIMLSYQRTILDARGHRPRIGTRP